MHQHLLKIYKMFRKHPKIEIKPSKTDIKLILVGWVLVCLNFILVLVFYFDLPETIPTHFNLKGKVDDFGNKSTLWILPIINLICYFCLTWVTTKVKPHNYNYPTRVTQKNAPILYAMSIKMVVRLNLGIAMLFLLITVHTILSAKEVTNNVMGSILAVLVFTLILGPFIYIVKMFKVPK